MLFTKLVSRSFYTLQKHYWARPTNIWQHAVHQCYVQWGLYFGAQRKGRKLFWCRGNCLAITDVQIVFASYFDSRILTDSFSLNYVYFFLYFSQRHLTSTKSGIRSKCCLPVSFIYFSYCLFFSISLRQFYYA